MTTVKDENYFVVKGWMINRLNLKGSELLIYSIIYGFSQDGESEFSGSLKYLSEFTGLSRSTVITALKMLVDKKLLIRRDEQINGILLPKYKINLDVVNCTGSTKIILPRTESTPYNIVDNIDTPSINSISKDIELKDEEYKGKETSPSRTLENNSNKKSSLEDFRKNYITDSKTKNKDVNEVIEHLNNITGKKYKSNTPETVKLITARLKDGYTVDDMKKVISHRWELWKGTDMEQYVRPSTLFRPSKFEGYLNSLETKRKVGNRGCPDTLNMFGINSKNAYNKTNKDKEFSEEEF